MYGISLSTPSHLVTPGWLHLCRRPPSVRELKRWASLIVALGLRGWKLQAALSTAFDHVYVRGEIVEEARLVAAATFKAHFEGTAMKAIIEVRAALLFLVQGASSFSLGESLTIVNAMSMLEMEHAQSLSPSESVACHVCVLSLACSAGSEHCQSILASGVASAPLCTSLCLPLTPYKFGQGWLHPAEAAI